MSDGGSTHRVEPPGVFLEVPYVLLGKWTAGGYTWGEIVVTEGLPAAVCERLTADEARWCVKVVRLWASFAAYQEATGEPGCKPGRAFLGPPHTDSLGCCLLTAVMDRPMRVARGRWKW